MQVSDIFGDCDIRIEEKNFQCSWRTEMFMNILNTSIICIPLRNRVHLLLTEWLFRPCQNVSESEELHKIKLSLLYNQRLRMFSQAQSKSQRCVKGASDEDQKKGHWLQNSECLQGTTMAPTLSSFHPSLC